MIINCISLFAHLSAIFGHLLDGLLRGGGGVQGQKSWKHDFEIIGDQKGPPSGSTFWSGFEAPES